MTTLPAKSVHVRVPSEKMRGAADYLRATARMTAEQAEAATKEVVCASARALSYIRKTVGRHRHMCVELVRPNKVCVDRLYVGVKKTVARYDLTSDYLVNQLDAHLGVVAHDAFPADTKASQRFVRVPMGHAMAMAFFTWRELEVNALEITSIAICYAEDGERWNAAVNAALDKIRMSTHMSISALGGMDEEEDSRESFICDSPMALAMLDTPWIMAPV